MRRAGLSILSALACVLGGGHAKAHDFTVTGLPRDVQLMLQAGAELHNMVEGAWEVVGEDGRVVASFPLGPDGRLGPQQLDQLARVRRFGVDERQTAFTTTFDGFDLAGVSQTVASMLGLTGAHDVLHVASGRNALISLILNKRGFNVTAVDPFLRTDLALPFFHRAGLGDFARRRGPTFDRVFSFFGPTASVFATPAEYRGYVASMRRVMRPGGLALLMGRADAHPILNDYFDLVQHGQAHGGRWLLLRARPFSTAGMRAQVAEAAGRGETRRQVFNQARRARGLPLR